MMSSLALQYVMCVAVICWCSGNEQKIGFGAAGIRQRQRDIQSTCICHKMHQSITGTKTKMRLKIEWYFGGLRRVWSTCEGNQYLETFFEEIDE